MARSFPGNFWSCACAAINSRMIWDILVAAGCRESIKSSATSGGAVSACNRMFKMASCSGMSEVTQGCRRACASVARRNGSGTSSPFKSSAQAGDTCAPMLTLLSCNLASLASHKGPLFARNISTRSIATSLPAQQDRSCIDKNCTAPGTQAPHRVVRAELTGCGRPTAVPDMMRGIIACRRCRGDSVSSPISRKGKAPAGQCISRPWLYTTGAQLGSLSARTWLGA